MTPAAAVGGGGPHRIDVHHHLSPPPYVAALTGRQLGQRPTLDWPPARSLEDMDRAGVATAKWLGDPAFAPPMDELNRRKAVVYTHPTAANRCRNLVPDVPESIIEFVTDTSRTIASLVFSGTAARRPDLRIIFSHAGGTMPFLTERFTRLPLLNKSLETRVPNGVAHELRRFYYDTAQASHPMALASLLKLIPVSQVVFGTGAHRLRVQRRRPPGHPHHPAALDQRSHVALPGSNIRRP